MYEDSLDEFKAEFSAVQGLAFFEADLSFLTCLFGKCVRLCVLSWQIQRHYLPLGVFIVLYDLTVNTKRNATET